MKQKVYSIFSCSFSVLIMFGWLGVASAIDIVPPKKWQQQSKLPSGIVAQYISATKADDFSPNLNISRSKLPCCKEDDTSVDSLIKKVTSMQERIFPLYRIKEKGKRKIKTINGGYIVNTYAQGTRDLAILQFFFLKGEEFYNVVYTCLSKDLERLRPEFEKSLATITLDEPTLKK